VNFYDQVLREIVAAIGAALLFGNGYALIRNESYNTETDQRGTAEIIVAKHRNGPTGNVRLAFLDHFTKFSNMARE